MQTSKLCVDPATIARADDSEFAKYVDNIVACMFLVALSVFLPPSAFARIENHYFVNEVENFVTFLAKGPDLYDQGFTREGQLLEKQEIDKM